ncbi:MAG: tRNA (adenosine(37)-N6)-dimethylallyltransferase MiaA [Holophagaceae bacterium]|nr:tRNA (adenosine(37)-N6)-dimethylallyltransferase MiaA [Holophagaceae bacterium]
MRIAILGPTASGKSTLAVAVARRLEGAVVNGDPFQALDGLAIGTGQPFAAEQGGVPHVGYGVLPLSSRTNPAEFGALVRGWLADLEAPVLVTGSGLYLRGIWNQLTALPEVPEALVAKVRRLGQDLGAPRLHRYLRAVDPDRAAGLHPNDGARIQRALALHLATGLRPSALLTGVAPVPAGWQALVVRPTRERQRERIAARVAAQLAQGWREEARRLREAGHGPDLAALRPLGYDLLLEAGVSPAQARDRIVQATQAYAKRQATWFRNQLPEVPGWDPDGETLNAAFAKLEIG